MNLDRRTFLKSSLVVLISMGIPVSKVFSGMAQMEINPMNLLKYVEVTKRAILLNKEDMDNLTCQLVVHLYKQDRIPNETQLKNLSYFLTHIPVERGFQFLCYIDPLLRNSKEFRIITNIHQALMKSDEYEKKFYNRVTDYSEICYVGGKLRSQKVKDMQIKGFEMLQKYYSGANIVNRVALPV